MRPEWIDKGFELARAEVERLHATARYQLGRAFIEAMHRPWRLPLLVGTALRLRRRGGTGHTPPLSPPQPVPDQVGPAGPDDPALPARLAELKALWQQAWDLEASPAFRLGQVLIESLAGPRELLRLPVALARPSTPTPNAVALESPVQAPRAAVVAPAPARPAWRAVGPPWLEEMLALEGVDLEPGGPVPSGPLLCGVQLSRWDGDVRARIESAVAQAAAAGDTVAVWLLDEPAREPLPMDLLGRATAVYAADPRLAADLAGQLSAPVAHLPPAVQPRLHNPIGWWNGRPDLAVSGRHEQGMPSAWRALVDLARTRASAAQRGAAESALGASLPEPAAPAWADPDWARDVRRQALTRHVLGSATLEQRLGRIRHDLGPAAPARPPLLVTLFACTHRATFLDRLADNVARQTYPRLELVLVRHGQAVDRDAIKRRLDHLPVRLRLVDAPADCALGEALRRGCEASSGAILCRMDDDDWYGAHYVGDCVAALGFSEAYLVAKLTFVLQLEDKDRLYLCQPGLEYQYGAFRGGGPRVAFRREMLDWVAYRPINRVEDIWLVRDCLSGGLPILLTDRFNFVYRRRHPSGHASKRTAPELVRVLATRPFPRSARLEDFQ